MVDINFSTPVGGFSVRAAAVILRGAEVLLCHFDGGRESSFWFLPGGRVQLFESSSAALERELFEELGVHVTCGRLLWIAENAFPAQGVPTHELVFYYSATLPESAPLGSAAGRISGVEPDSKISFAWHQLSQLGDVDLRPALIKDRLTQKAFEFQQLVTLDKGNR